MTLRVLITGSSGFGGHFLAREACANGAMVYGLSRRGDAPTDTLPLAVDLADAHATAAAVQQAAPEYIFHLAAQTPASVPGNSDEAWLTVNALTTYNLLEAARLYARDARIVIVSSSAVYGHVAAADMPIAELQPLRPTTMYGVSKATQELLATRYVAELGRATMGAGPSTQSGPGQPAGWLISMLARQVIRIAAGLEPPVVRMRHRATSRDFTDIRDTTRALWALAGHGTPGEVYNICSGVATPIGMLAERLLAIAGVAATIETTGGAPAPGDILVQVGDAARLTAATGWRPALSLDTSLADLLGAMHP